MHCMDRENLIIVDIIADSSVDYGSNQRYSSLVLLYLCVQGVSGLYVVLCAVTILFTNINNIFTRSFRNEGLNIIIEFQVFSYFKTTNVYMLCCRV